MEKKIYNELRASKIARKKRMDRSLDPHIEDRPLTTYGDQRENLRDFHLEEVKNLLLEDNIAQKFLGIIGQGKEANVYWIKDMKNEDVAVKMFRIHTTSHNLREYHARSKLSDTAKLSITSRFCHREYLNLHTLYDVGVRDPKPLNQAEFFYSMEFLGTKRGPSPLMRDVNLFELGFDIVEVMDDILDQLDILFNRGMMVHGDFSEHNIILHKGKFWIIDFLQSQPYHLRYATPLRIAKKEALPILRRDIENILTYFKKNYRVNYDPQTVYKEILGEEPDWIPDTLMTDNFNVDTFITEEKRVKYD